MTLKCIKKFNGAAEHPLNFVKCKRNFNPSTFTYGDVNICDIFLYILYKYLVLVFEIISMCHNIIKLSFTLTALRLFLVTDPAFPRRGRQSIILANFPKNYTKMKIIRPGGAYIPAAPGSANVLDVVIRVFHGKRRISSYLHACKCTICFIKLSFSRYAILSDFRDLLVNFYTLIIEFSYISKFSAKS